MSRTRASKSGRRPAVRAAGSEPPVLREISAEEIWPQFRDLHENFPIGLYRTTPQGKVLLANSALLAMLRIGSLTELAQLNLEQGGYHPDYPRQQFKEAIEREGAVHGWESAWRRADGTTVYVRENARAVRDRDGRIVCYDGAVEDISELKQVEASLREAEARYRGLVESAFEGYVIHQGGFIIDANLAYARMFGYQLRELIGRPVLEMSAPEVRKKVRAIIARNDEKPYESIGLRKDGRPFFIETSGRSCAYRGQPARIAAVRDITERKQMEERLWMVMTAVESATDAIGISDVHGRHFYHNKALSDLFGYPTAGDLQAAGGGPALVKDPKVFREMFDRIQSGRPWIGELEMVRKDGSVFQAFERANAIQDETGRLIGLFGIITDITERKRAEKTLLESEERFRTVFEHAGEGIVVADVATKKLVHVNPAYCAMYGYSAEEMLQLQVDDLHPKDAVAHAKAEFAAQARREKVLSPNLPCLRKDGSVFFADVNTRPVTIAGQPMVVGFFTDVTIRRQVEADRANLSKLESTGLLAAGIAHDFNNLLTTIQLGVDLARTEITHQGTLRDTLQDVLDATQAARNLTRQFITLSHGCVPNRQLVEVEPLVRSAVRLVLSGTNVACQITASSPHQAAVLDADQIGQVVRNLALNAREAMPDGGKITITLDKVALPAGNETSLPPGDYLKLKIADEGKGIPPEVLPRIFDPYFSTKRRGEQKGMGLGLTVCHSIVRKHGGAITVESAPQQGTIFDVFLPASDLARPAKPPTSACPPAGRVLVMDDEANVRKLIGLAADRSGWEVTPATNGEEAIEHYRRALESGRPYDVVLLDLTVRTGMGAVDTVRVLRELHPSVHALVMSAYANHEVIEQYAAYGFANALIKPFSLASLRGLLSQIRSA